MWINVWYTGHKVIFQRFKGLNLEWMFAMEGVRENFL